MAIGAPGSASRGLEGEVFIYSAVFESSTRKAGTRLRWGLDQTLVLARRFVPLLGSGMRWRQLGFSMAASEGRLVVGVKLYPQGAVTPIGGVVMATREHGDPSKQLHLAGTIIPPEYEIMPSNATVQPVTYANGTLSLSQPGVQSFGHALSVTDQYLAIGAPNDASPSTVALRGATILFRSEDSNILGPMAGRSILRPLPRPGGMLEETAGARFGSAVVVTPGQVLIGAPEGSVSTGKLFGYSSYVLFPI